MMDTLVKEPYPWAIKSLLSAKKIQKQNRKTKLNKTSAKISPISFREFLTFKDREAAHAFERGEISEREFFRDFYLDDLSDEIRINLPRPQKVKKMLFQNIAYLAGMRELLISLQAMPNVLTGIASNYSEWYKIILKTLPELKDCDYLFFSCEMACRKPQKGYYEKINRALLQGQSPLRSAQEIFFVDDRKVNIEGAEQVGWRTYLMSARNAHVDKLSAALTNFLVVKSGA